MLLVKTDLYMEQPKRERLLTFKIVVPFLSVIVLTAR